MLRAAAFPGPTETAWLAGMTELVALSTLQTSGSPPRDDRSPVRWRAKSMGASGWRGVVRAFGDRHVPIQVKAPEATPDPVTFDLVVVQPFLQVGEGELVLRRIIMF